ncbi:hypothetical protein ElyMa_003589000 [Elysia marginata]|uniref:Uncharacterized protein n=1 Tax=Elysia marginata TaxID=1093978 RepID=A0AAV4ERF9_9GAST|nr:hypothetical protein ElyMa_003589000 [Elysia marginata]
MQIWYLWTELQSKLQPPLWWSTPRMSSHDWRVYLRVRCWLRGCKMHISVTNDDDDDLRIKSQRDTTKATQIHSGSDIQGEYDMQDQGLDPEEDGQEERRSFGSKDSERHYQTEPERHGPEESRSFFTEISDVLKGGGKRQQAIGSHSSLAQDVPEAIEPLDTEL